MRTIVLGLGNPYGGDDGVGPSVARALQGHLVDPEVTVREASLGGVRLLELLSGYDRAILVDAIRTPGGKPGTIRRLSGAELRIADVWNPSSHGRGLLASLEAARKIGTPTPNHLMVLAIEVAPWDGLSEGSSPEVEAAIPKAVEIIRKELGSSPRGAGRA
jgi:hydrogenase maturation protease